MPDKVYVITGPTSGFGRRTALELAKHGTVVLVGRNAAKLDDVRSSIEGRGGKAVSVLCDLSDLTSVRRAVAQITELGLPITGVLNNAGIFPNRPGTNALGWDIAYATNHIGPFVFTETLVPHLKDGTQVVFIVSAVEDPERKAATMAGFRGARYISAEASTRGEWKPGGSKLPGADAYATSKQCNLATVLALARETPRLRFNAIEPGFAPGTNLGRDAGLLLRLLSKYVLSPLAPLIKYWTNPGTAARMITRILTDESDTTGVYYDEKGRPMRGSPQVHDPAFNARVVAETRALLGTAHV
ncbi:SDR family NAD(P)-dependent oxidoreductase [Streptomyces sp. NPDC127079]|uniref:SDR family NAD(P)-dependent oxidoreductase n=1 Tax=Streptomyces sp. NPDC127079 TaxID=3347132 RepID=UPI003657DBCF